MTPARCTWRRSEIDTTKIAGRKFDIATASAWEDAHAEFLKR